jgi:hypothetical protein
MRKAKTFIFFAFIFLAGTLTASFNEWLQPISTVEITNGSSKEISYIDIIYQGAYKSNSRIAENLKTNEVFVFKGITFGETNYSLEVKFDDGTIIKGGAGYHERGNFVKEYITNTSVLSSRRFFPSLVFSEPRSTTFVDEKINGEDP